MALDSHTWGLRPRLNKSINYYALRLSDSTWHGTANVIGTLVVDLGLSFQPFRFSYDQYGDWVTTSWLKRVWEKVSFFDFELTINNLPTSYPREGDDWLMARFIAMRYTKEQLRILNRVRKHQQILFLSVILEAGGGSVDKRYLTKRLPGERWSLMKFP